MDCQMPDMDGCEATRIQRGREMPVANSLRTALKEALMRWLGPASASKTELQQVETTMREEPLADCWDEPAMLKQLEGYEELLLELIELFINSVPARLVELNGALATDDLPGIANAAHVFMGMTGQFFAQSARNCAAQLEDSARHAKDADLAVLSANLTEAVTGLILVLQQRKEESS
jgi:HPt (histidine-containing phosphotransfer) domain-containing protein